jgi:hypothetical protein
METGESFCGTVWVRWTQDQNRTPYPRGLPSGDRFQLLKHGIESIAHSLSCCHS